MKPSTQQQRDEYHITIATLLGCELGTPGGRWWRYATTANPTYYGWSQEYPTPARAARAWLIANNHDLDEWCENDEERDDPHK